MGNSHLMLYFLCQIKSHFRQESQLDSAWLPCHPRVADSAGGPHDDSVTLRHLQDQEGSSQHQEATPQVFC